MNTIRSNAVQQRRHLVRNARRNTDYRCYATVADICFFEESELTCHHSHLLLLLFLSISVTINTLFIFLSLLMFDAIYLSVHFTPETLKEDQETRSWTVITEVSMTTGNIILYTSSVRTECTTVQYVIDKREWM